MGISFKSVLVQLMRTPLYDLITSQMPHLLILSLWALGFQQMSVGHNTQLIFVE